VRILESTLSCKWTLIFEVDAGIDLLGLVDLTLLSPLLQGAGSEPFAESVKSNLPPLPMADGRVRAHSVLTSRALPERKG
jgi:hypothetical protein